MNKQANTILVSIILLVGLIMPVSAFSACNPGYSEATGRCVMTEEKLNECHNCHSHPENLPIMEPRTAPLLWETNDDAHHRLTDTQYTAVSSAVLHPDASTVDAEGVYTYTCLSCHTNALNPDWSVAIDPFRDCDTCHNPGLAYWPTIHHRFVSASSDHKISTAERRDGLPVGCLDCHRVEMDVNGQPTGMPMWFRN